VPEPVPAFAAPLRGRRVLLTGHTGFKGAWLALWLSRLGASVTGFALPPATSPNVFQAARVEGGVERSVEGDLRDRAHVEAVVREARPELVLHLAAQSLVPAAAVAPVETFEVNVLGTAHVLEAVRVLGRPCAVVVVTSDKCYEDRDQVWGYRESDALGGSEPYAASKAGAELVVAAYQRSYFAPGGASGVLVASARAGNVLGGGDWAPQRLVPDAIRALVAGEVLRLRNPGQVRPWQHVLEPLAGYLLLAARLLEGDATVVGPWNFGPVPGEEAAVTTLVDEVFAAWGDGRWTADAGLPTPETAQLRLAVDKAVAELGWRPAWPRREVVRRTVAWYRRYHRGDGDARAACLDDITAYEAAMGGLPG
jgi:CDP-glucose 4,6-dehydratase